MGKGTNSFDYRTFASYLLPKDILKFFEVTDIEGKCGQNPGP